MGIYTWKYLAAFIFYALIFEGPHGIKKSVKPQL